MSADGVPPIPRPFLEEAEADLSPAQIVRRWRKYVAWNLEKRGGRDYRIQDWQRHINWELEASSPEPPLAPVGSMAPREVERAIEDEQYSRTAVTFATWLRMPNEHDAAFREWRTGQDARSPRAWGVDALDAFGAHLVATGAKCTCVRCRTVLRVNGSRRVVGQRVLPVEEFETRRRAQLDAARPLLEAERASAEVRFQGSVTPTLDGTFVEGLGLEGTGTGT